MLLPALPGQAHCSHAADSPPDGGFGPGRAATFTPEGARPFAHFARRCLGAVTAATLVLFVTGCDSNSLLWQLPWQIILMADQDSPSSRAPDHEPLLADRSQEEAPAVVVVNDQVAAFPRL